MRTVPVLLAVLIAAFTLTGQHAAKAQSVTPQQIQAQIANGQEQAAISELQTVLQSHPSSGPAWFLTAEAQDAAGNPSAARSALANADHYAPGLPFARASDVAALRAHLAGGPGASTQQHSGISPMLIGVVVLVVLFLAVRMFFRRRRFLTPQGYPAGYGPAPGGYPPGQGPGFGQPGYGQPGFGGMGGGMGSSLMGGLAAGAGFAAGERVIDDVFGRNNNNGNNNSNNSWDNNNQQDSGNGGVPDRDDGLQGNPGWDDGSGGGDNSSDSGNSW